MWAWQQRHVVVVQTAWIERLRKEIFDCRAEHFVTNSFPYRYVRVLPFRTTFSYYLFVLPFRAAFSKEHLASDYLISSHVASPRASIAVCFGFVGVYNCLFLF
jgi:hypothetical protein